MQAQRWQSYGGRKPKRLVVLIVATEVLLRHCSLTRLPVDAWVIPETDSGGPLASPRWRFCGHGSRLGSNEKVEMTLSTLEKIGRGPLGLIYVFSPGSI